LSLDPLDQHNLLVSKVKKSSDATLITDLLFQKY